MEYVLVSLFGLVVIASIGYRTYRQYLLMRSANKIIRAQKAEKSNNE